MSPSRYLSRTWALLLVAFAPSTADAEFLHRQPGVGPMPTPAPATAPAPDSTALLADAKTMQTTVATLFTSLRTTRAKMAELDGIVSRLTLNVTRVSGELADVDAAAHANDKRGRFLKAQSEDLKLRMSALTNDTAEMSQKAAIAKAAEDLVGPNAKNISGEVSAVEAKVKVMSPDGAVALHIKAIQDEWLTYEATVKGKVESQMGEFDGLVQNESLALQNFTNISKHGAFVLRTAHLENSP